MFTPRPILPRLLLPKSHSQGAQAEVRATDLPSLPPFLHSIWSWLLLPFHSRCTVSEMPFERCRQEAQGPPPPGLETASSGHKAQHHLLMGHRLLKGRIFAMYNLLPDTSCVYLAPPSTLSPSLNSSWQGAPHLASLAEAQCLHTYVAWNLTHHVRQLGLALWM